MPSSAVLRSTAIRLLTALCLMLGVLAGQTASASPSHALTASMSDDMDCCPKKPVPVQCPKCTLMASCSAALPADAFRSFTSVAIVTLVARDLPGDERTLEGRDLAPPPRPPRSLV